MMETVNPAMKACAVLIPGILLGLTFDVVTPLLYFVFVISITFTLSSISLKKWLKIFAPFPVVALSFAWMAILYASEDFAGGKVLVSFWVFDITTGSLRVGISLALRSLCFVSLSLLFILTTDPTKFMLSLMQQFRLPPKVTYGILAGYRFLPTFKNELMILRQAHRVRGVGREKGLKGKLRTFRRYTIPLLANGIRKAERVAIAMESKGFTGDWARTHYHRMQIAKRDWIFLFGMISALVLAFATSFYFGYLQMPML